MSTRLEVMRKQLLEQQRVFLVPETGIYFCLEHLEFAQNRPTMKLHLVKTGHPHKGASQCSSCLNFFSSKAELRRHREFMGGGAHTLPFPPSMALVKNGRIGGGDEEEEGETEEGEEGGEEGEEEGAAQDIGQESTNRDGSVPMVQNPLKVLPVTYSACIQDLKVEPGLMMI